MQVNVIKITKLLFLYLCMTRALTGCVEMTDPQANLTVNTNAQIQSQGIMIQGSVGDGPIINAEINIFDANNNLVAKTTSDSEAKYSVVIPDNANFPLVITADNGTDLVGYVPQSFTMKSVIMDGSNIVSNINPFSTIIVDTMSKMPGGLTRSNLDDANLNILKQLNFGLDTSQVPNPITTPITDGNIATIVKSSEALAETIRRVQTALLVVGNNIDNNGVIDAIAADFIDGSLDGTGGIGANPVVSAATKISSGQVLIETLGNNLKVNGGMRATELMDTSIRISMPTATDNTADVLLNAEILDQTLLSINHAQMISPSAELTNLENLVNNLTPNMLATDVTNTGIAVTDSVHFDSAISNVVLADQRQIEHINSTVSIATGNSSSTSTSQTNNQLQPIILTWQASAGIIQGYIVYFGETADTASVEVSNISVNEPGFNAQAPGITYDPILDLNLGSGDSACFRVIAYNADGLSDFSQAICTTL